MPTMCVCVELNTVLNKLFIKKLFLHIAQEGLNNMYW
jgi:hypothetical protein